MAASSSQDEIPPPPPPPPSSKYNPTKTLIYYTQDKIKVLPPRTADARLLVAEKERRKARTTLLWLYIEAHLAKISLYPTIGPSQSVYDRFHSLLSLLEIHEAGVSTEDANQKFLRSLPSAWSQVSLIMRTKLGVDTLSFDDLYNNLRVFESDIKGSTASSSSSPQIIKGTQDTKWRDEWEFWKQGWSRMYRRERERDEGVESAVDEKVGIGQIIQKLKIMFDGCNSSDSDTEFAEGMHAVPPPMTGNYMPSGPKIEIDYSQFTNVKTDLTSESGIPIKHMTGNKAYLAEFQDFNGGPVAFGGSKGYITGKGKIKTGKLDFEDVCFVKELQHFNLFSVSQMCDKKNKFLVQHEQEDLEALVDESWVDASDRRIVAVRDTENEGRSREMVDEDKEFDENILSTEDVLSTDKEGVSTDLEKVSTDRPIVSTDGSKVSTDMQFEGTDEHVEDDETIAKVLIHLIQAKPGFQEKKEKGVELKDIDPKDKGKKKIKEEDESESESDGIPEAEKKFKQLESNEEMARKIQETE
ncbi:hypothetical protein Tco_1386745 [Tanacetum coccineum]